jgi:hypothetical protein
MSHRSTSEAVDFRRSIRRLAAYRPFSPRNYRVGSVIRQLVLAAAHENGGQLGSCADCQSDCQALWGLELERGEISAAVEQLIGEGKMVREPTFLRLTEECSRELADRVRTSSEVEAAAFEEWVQAVSKAVPGLGREELAQLVEDLSAWINHIIVEYGMTAAVLLYPEQDQFKRRLNEIKMLGFGPLPKRGPAVMMVRPAALTTFIEDMTHIQRRYFDNMLITAHLMSILTLEPDALRGVRQLTSGQRLYLDTNVVYSVLKLHGTRRYYLTQRVLALSRRLGYQVCVTPWTVLEMQESVRNGRERLLRAGPSPQAIAGLAPSVMDDDTYATFKKAVRRMERDEGISPEDFFALHEQVEPLLLNEGIEVVDIGCEAVEGDPGDFNEEIAALERVRQGPEKPRSVQEHDVKHRLLVKRLRGDTERDFASACCLVLTDDHALMRYARASRKHRDEIPFAMTVTEWGHIVRSLYPRTTDYDKTMSDIGETPVVRARGLLTQLEVIEAIRRVNSHENLSQAAATLALLNGALGRDDEPIEGERQAGGESTPDTGDAGLEAQMIFELLQQLTAEQEAHAAHDVEMKARLATERRARLEAEQRLKRIGQRKAGRGSIRGEDEQGADNAPHGRSDKRPSPPSRGDVAQRLTRQEHIVRWLVASLISVVGAAVLAVPLGTRWITSGWPLVGDICGGGAIFVGAFAWLFGFQRASALVTSIGVILDIVVAVQIVIS